MNDMAPYDAAADAGATRILALGDSHTAAVGVSGHETWVAQLERRLNETQPSARFVCHNAAAVGYSLHQYLTRLLDQGPVVAPHYVIVGFSYATDLFDLLPPDRGGWIYGAKLARVYWDLDQGKLVEKYWASDAPSGAAPAPRSLALSLRSFLEHFATFRYLRRSPLALTIGARVRPGGQSLWPNMEVIVEREPNPELQYQWELALALLRKLDEEATRLGAKLIVVGIPYLPQVYDDIWDATFGGDARFSPTAASERVSRFLAAEGIAYVEARDAMREYVREHGRWVHHRRDGHPTAEGQAVIAEAVLAAHLVEPRPGEKAAAAR
jgi:lysophospholipase L1-like esterase